MPENEAPPANYLRDMQAMATSCQVARGLALVVDIQLEVGDRLDLSLVRAPASPVWERSIIPPCVVRGEDLPVLKLGERIRNTYTPRDFPANFGLALEVEAPHHDTLGFGLRRMLALAVRQIARAREKLQGGPIEEIS